MRGIREAHKQPESRAERRAGPGHRCKCIIPSSHSPIHSTPPDDVDDIVRCRCAFVRGRAPPSSGVCVCMLCSMHERRVCAVLHIATPYVTGFRSRPGRTHRTHRRTHIPHTLEICIYTFLGANARAHEDRPHSIRLVQWGRRIHDKQCCVWSLNYTEQRRMSADHHLSPA